MWGVRRLDSPPWTPGSANGRPLELSTPTLCRLVKTQDLIMVTNALHHRNMVDMHRINDVLKNRGQHSTIYCQSVAKKSVAAIGELSHALKQNVGSERMKELEKLIRVLPTRIQECLLSQANVLTSVVEIVLDYGRVPIARLHDGSHSPSPRGNRDIRLSEEPVTRDEIAHVARNCSDFGDDNRAGIDGTLHRISAIKNRDGETIGITCRVGEAVQGSADMIRDLALGGKSMLLLGRPGVGKTTVIRELARLLSGSKALKRVMIVDTSNEIGGDGDICHHGIGRARRMQVSSPAHQHKVMIEAVENHMPDVIIIDEIGTQEESLAARSIAERGVQLIATAHGNQLENLMKNPSLQDLLGGISPVTLGDVESKKRGVQKTVLERSAPPTFDIVIELIDRYRWIVHSDVSFAVDELLKGKEPKSEIRELMTDGTVHVSSKRERIEVESSLGGVRLDSFPRNDDLCKEKMTNQIEEQDATTVKKTPVQRKKADKKTQDFDKLILYIECIDNDNLIAVKEELKDETRVMVSEELEGSHCIVTTRSALKTNAWIKEVAKYSRMPLFFVRSSTTSGIVKGIHKIINQGMLPQRLYRRGDEDVGPSTRHTSIALQATGGILECKSAVDDIVMKKLTPLEFVPKDQQTMIRIVAMAEEYRIGHTWLGSKKDGTLRVRLTPHGYRETSPEDAIEKTQNGRKVDIW